MRFSEFEIGDSFWCSGKQYEVTDIGTRVVVAIRIDQVEVIRSGAIRETITFVQAKREGWFNGPPYAVAEHVFDENDFPACSRNQERLAS